jgi:hypothetical protein
LTHRGHNPVIIVRAVNKPTVLKLTQVVQALIRLGIGAGLGQGGQEHHGQQTERGDHDEQLNEGKSVVGFGLRY